VSERRAARDDERYVPHARRTLVVAHPIDVRVTLAPLSRGRGDDTTVLLGRGVWRATRTPEGAATQWVRNEGGAIAVDAWGPGASWVVEHADELVGATDDSTSFVPADPMISELHRRYSSVRIPRSRAVWETLFPTVLEQKVTGLEARRSLRALHRHFREPAPAAPGAPRLHLPPAASAVEQSPAWVFHRVGVEAKRGDTLRIAAQHGARLDALPDRSLGEAQAWLSKLPGIGPWTVAEVSVLALGDADAVSVGDYHLKNTVSWALAGEARGTDERMLELLMPYAGHRARVIRYLALAGIGAPRYGPRLAPRDWHR
jgi:3-methyladenine DNA glycosylase/8-oxoguanine DNA glycosylase